MNYDTSENKNNQTGKRNDEHVKISIVSLSNAVTNPWTMVIKTLCIYEKVEKNVNLIEDQLDKPNSMFDYQHKKRMIQSQTCLPTQLSQRLQ